MLKKIAVVFIGVSTLIFNFYSAQATHIMGADLSFKCIGTNEIEFTLALYRDCDPTSATLGGTQTIAISSILCGFTSSCTVILLSSSPTEVSPLCPLQINQSECNGGSLPGVQQYLYKGSMILNQPCTDYLFSWESCCRNGAITNIVAPLNTGLRVEATWNKLAADCNDSPAFSALPVPYICQGQLVNYNNGGYDPNGDSLVYTLITPMSSTGAVQAFQYSSPWNSTYPLTTQTGAVVFDPGTGQLTFTALNLEITCLAIKIEEYRNDTLIGSVMRDIQVNVLNCSNLAPEQNLANFENLQGGVITGPNTIEVCPGSSMSFDVFGHDADSNNLSLYSNISTVLNGGSFIVTQYDIDSASIHLSWTPTGSDTGNYVITVSMTDDACPVFGQATYAFVINVPKSTDAGPDISLCWPDTSAQLSVVGGLTFAWTPSAGLNDTSIYNPFCIPTQTTTYYVESDLSSNCKNKDTIVVFVLPAIVLNPTSSADTVCAGDQIQLTAGITGGGGSAFNILWTSVGTPFNSTQTNPNANPLIPTTYYLDVSSGLCEQNDSVYVFARPLPSSDFVISPTDLCPYQHAIVSYTGSTTGLLNNWTFGSSNIITGSGFGPYEVYWLNSGVFTIKLDVTDLTGCSTSTIKAVNVHPTPNANFSGQPVEGCNPILVNFLNESTGGDSTYSWNFGDGSSSSFENPFNIYSNSGDFDVTLIATTFWGCKDTIEKSGYIHIIDHVVPSFTTTAVSGLEYDLSVATFSFTNTSQYADTYLWNFGDGSTSTELNPIHTYLTVGNYMVTLTASNEFCTEIDTFKVIVIVSWDDIVFPSGFTPNNDGDNDLFRELYKDGVVTLSFKVYDRWGAKVFETNNVNGYWDGKFNGLDCELGVYSWEASATMLNKHSLYKKGNVTLIR